MRQQGFHPEDTPKGHGPPTATQSIRGKAAGGRWYCGSLRATAAVTPADVVTCSTNQCLWKTLLVAKAVLLFTGLSCSSLDAAARIPAQGDRLHCIDQLSSRGGMAVNALQRFVAMQLQRSTRCYRLQCSH